MKRRWTSPYQGEAAPLRERVAKMAAVIRHLKERQTQLIAASKAALDLFEPDESVGLALQAAIAAAEEPYSPEETMPEAVEDGGDAHG